jgi:hypothetical protein
LLRCREKGVGARDIRAFTPIYDGLMRGHDGGERAVAALTPAAAFLQPWRALAPSRR